MNKQLKTLYEELRRAKLHRGPGISASVPTRSEAGSMLAKLNELLGEAPPELSARMERTGQSIILHGDVRVVGRNGRLQFETGTSGSLIGALTATPTVLSAEHAAELLVEWGITSIDIESSWANWVDAVIRCDD